ncbi:unnamed protein product [Cuscuta campestris]|uniref:Reverse transcriptase domain-containing protein n=1 Tax=Cuscuta campestris TaxID=132261 RepID=A0A484KG11_9ASTE|nr:unnamed protein product [Cuscuta campestris]
MEVARILVEYYKGILGTPTHTDDVDDKVMNEGGKLSIEQQLSLISEVKDEQVREAFFGIPNSKSPGPDGFSSGFYKNQWDVQMAQEKDFKFHPMCKSLKLINLCFADDLIIVCKAEEESLRCIMDVIVPQD